MTLLQLLKEDSSLKSGKNESPSISIKILKELILTSSRMSLIFIHSSIS